ncbi:hypothetical protein V6N11_053151 [Hibiscus sabdariffa]|uniref:Dehydrogenase E1 component domain-containing protein n=1 Tax=Hibiscus sabdariffa TaxID=183260 RepID=A0ABR2UCH9_9ROSI
MVAGTSEGDFHAGLNFAAVMEAPVIFFCRNNGWAISTNVSEQFRSDGIVVKGRAYGIRSIRVDRNDALAVYSVVCAAREMAINEQRPILIELDEIVYWKNARNPVNRFRNWVQNYGWWSEQQETQLRNSVRKQLLEAIQVAEKTEKPPLSEMFSDVYDYPPSNLEEQEKHLRETITRHPNDYPSDISV